MSSSSDKIFLLSATELLSLYRRRQLSPVEATRAVFDRIRACDGVVNAFCFLAEEAALAASKESEARWMKGRSLGVVDGVPTTIKDLVLTKGWPTLRGSQTTDKNQAWDEDAPATARLREQGAVLIGKTTTPEFGWKGVTDSSLTGITRNPWNTEMTPGGSSGGAAVAASLGMGALHLGTDAGGSIRIPSGFTGVFGIKPSFGRVPVYPPTPNASLAHAGPITRTVADAALMLTVISRPDPRDWLSLPFDERDHRIGLENGVVGLRIAFSLSLGYAEVDPEVAERVRDAVRVFDELGASVEEVDPGFKDPKETFRTIYYAAAAYLCRSLPPEQFALLDSGLKKIATEGAAIPVENYIKASIVERSALTRNMKAFHETYDLLLTPMLPIPAFPAGRAAPDEGERGQWIDWTPFSYPFNLTRQPACSVPCGFTPAGLPVGLQIVGPMYEEALVLRAARAFESARPFAIPDSPMGPME
jgi:aspartyl-tRNA(Asn)/glutamyl-tRNA(Gln) amidotransferase subunit A